MPMKTGVISEAVYGFKTLVLCQQLESRKESASARLLFQRQEREGLHVGLPAYLQYQTGLHTVIFSRLLTSRWIKFEDGFVVEKGYITVL